MFKSTEIRWFYKGKVPKEINDWFNSTISKPIQQDERTDYYLKTPGIDTLGIKIREGRIETKQRQFITEEYKINEKVSGYIEHFRKWTYALNDPILVKNDLNNYPEKWVGVIKQRSLHLLESSNKGLIYQPPPDTFLDEGCGWELTTIQIAGGNESWWTMGFEAFSKEDRQLNILKLTVNHIISLSEGIELTKENSYGYPNWIRGIS